MRGRTSRILLATAAFGAAAVAALLGGVLAEGRDTPATGAQQAPPQARTTAVGLLEGFGAGDTAAAVAGLEAKVAGGVADSQTLALLGVAYQQRSRETADPSFYIRSEQALQRALALDRRNALAVSGLASLALARHEFREALRLGRRARALEPQIVRHLAVIGDALVELGRYDEAFATFDRMAALKPSLASYSRVSYARELLGDTEGAIDAMRLALGPAQGSAEPTAWTRTHLGKLFFGTGRVDDARDQFRAALAAFPGYPYALEALALVEAAKGDRRQAIGLARRASEAVPLPQFVGTHADLLARAGRRTEARQQLTVVGAIERLLQANGVRTDLETAVFDLDHGLRLRAALARAREARAERPSIVGDDALAWALARNGQCQEALHWSKRALRLGTRDASMYFHRGYAERCAGNADEGRRWFRRALDLNPHFSLVWVPVARRWAA